MNMEYVFQLATGYQVSQALYVAVRLGIPDLLTDGPRKVTELALATDTNRDALCRVLRVLVNTGVLKEPAPLSFALTPIAEGLCAGGESIRDQVLWMANPFHHRAYADLLHCVKTGEPASNASFGGSFFDYLSRDAELREVFSASSTSFNALVMPAVMEAYDFSGIDTLVDIAVGEGFVLTTILRRYEKIQGVVSNLPQMVERADRRIRSLGLEVRCRAEASYFFTSVPIGGDTYLLKNVIHDWADDRALMILRNCRRALVASESRIGKLLLLETVVPEGSRASIASSIDVEMLTLTGGRERTQTEFGALLHEAGFRLTRVVNTKSAMSVIEACLV